MAKWEYKYQSNSQLPLIVDLNQLGAEGWQLVGIVGSTWVFMRATKEDQSDEP